MPKFEYIDLIDSGVGFALDLSAKGAEGYKVVMMDKLEDGRRRATMERMALNVATF